ncbi:MAG: hypothetical protein ABJB66_00595 [Gemmatimonadaceae bacterium]
MRKAKALLTLASAAFRAIGSLAAQIDQSQQLEAALYVGRTGSDACAVGCGSSGWGLHRAVG